MPEFTNIVLNGQRIDVQDAQTRLIVEHIEEVVEGYDDRIETLEDNFDAQTDAINDLGSAVRNNTNNIGNLGGRMNSLEQTAVDLSGRVGSAESKVDAVQANDAFQTNEILNLNNKVSQIGAVGEYTAGEIAVLKARMDEFSNLPEGSTTGDAELADIRNTFYGTTASNAGNAVREQAERIWDSDVDSSFANLLSPYYILPTSTNGVTITKDHDVYILNGTCTGDANKNIVYSEALPIGIAQNDFYVYPVVETELVKGVDINAQIFYHPAGGSLTQLYVLQFDEADKNYRLRIPANTERLLVRFQLINGVVYNNAKISIKLLNKNVDTVMMNKGAVATDGNLSNYLETGVYIVNANTGVTDKPDGESDANAGFLYVYHPNDAWVQYYVRYSAPHTMWMRRKLRTQSWSAWSEISGGGGGQQIFNNYENTYNVTANPTIISDATQFLQSTGDNTDRTNDIITMLSTTGVCRLGKGVYYIHDLVMPDSSAIIGSGNGTHIISTGSFGIKLGSYCCVKDLYISGSSTITPVETVGSTHGILWEGTATQDNTAPAKSVVENVKIDNFHGGGIACVDTGGNVSNCLIVSDCFITNCDCGIYIPYFSEYNKFNNVVCRGCYTGCINNGGNNMFICCDFSSSKIGFVIDNSDEQAPNNSHGSCVGCIFNHIDGNTGYAIKITNTIHGFVFEGCQIFFGKTRLQSCSGVTFANCNYGANNCDIEINGGATIIFANNLHQNAPVISISGNTNVHFSNCYVRSTGAIVTA